MPKLMIEMFHIIANDYVLAVMNTFWGAGMSEVICY